MLKKDKISKIAIDARYIGKTGIGTYIENILLEIVKKHQETYFVIFINDDKQRVIEQANLKYIKVDISPFSIKELLAFPVNQINKCDAFYSPTVNLPIGIRVPVYTTIHDLIFFDIPKIVSPFGRLIRNAYMKFGYYYSNTIFTVSKFTESRIRYHLGNKKRIIVTYSAISNEIKEFVINNNKNDSFIYVGNIKEHKGLTILLEAFKMAQKNGLKSKLIIVGNADRFASGSIDTSLLTGDNIFYTGYLNNQDLFKLIASSKALVLPSKYEGFGLPPLEALYLGTEVILSDIPVLKEIYQDLPSHYFKTGNVEDLADVLLSFNNRGINVDDIRELIDNKYNFNTISETIYQTIYNDIFKNDLSKS